MQPVNRDTDHEFNRWWEQNWERFRRLARFYAGGDADLGDEGFHRAGDYIRERWDRYGPTPDETHVRRILRCRVRDVLRRRFPVAVGEGLEDIPASTVAPERDLTVAEIKDAAPGWNAPMLAAALEYEQGHAQRKGALAAIESAIAAKEEDA